MAKQKSTRASAEDFVRTWQESDSTTAVAESLGISPVAASSRATNLRKKGVSLKRMPRGGNRGYTEEKIKELNKLAKSSLPKE